MKNKKKPFSEFSYNPQVTGDAEHGIVVADDVVQNVRDVEQLKPQIEQIEDVFSKLQKNTIISADNDYHSAENIDFLKERELDGYSPHEKLASGGVSSSVIKLWDNGYRHNQSNFRKRGAGGCSGI